MRKTTIKHEYLRRVIEEVESQDDPTMESLDSLVNELKHSFLILAADFQSDGMNFPTIDIEGEAFALLFTDMDEFRKVFSGNEFEASGNVFEFFREILNQTELKGFIINVASEGFIISKEMIDLLGEMPKSRFNPDEAYSSSELKQLKDSIDNDDLESFIRDPNNIGRYEELFEKISESTLLVLRLAREDLRDESEGGIINMKEMGPVGFLYTDKLYRNYAPVYTSEAKMADVKSNLNKYSQLVNFSQMTNSVLSNDMDGIIINPSTDNILLTRDVLMEFSPMLEEICNDPKLNSGIYHMFSMEDDSYAKN